MTPAQCRAARGLLDWTIPDLAAAAEVSRNTVSQFERGNRHPNRHTLRAMREALEHHGVVFTNGREPGVKLDTTNLSKQER